MEYRRVGDSDLVVSELSLGAATFGGSGEFFGAWGDTGVNQARAMVDLSLEAGINLFDTADVYSDGASEEVLGAALRGRRDDVLISTKAALPTAPDDWGTSPARLVRAVDNALARLQTDRIDLFQLHAYDAFTPIDEVLQALDTLVEAGKVRYTGVSNFSGWQLMKSLSLAEKNDRPRYIAHQVYYSLIGRDYEWELMPLASAEGIGALVWSPLGWGRLTGKLRRGRPLPDRSRLHATADAGPPVDDDLLYGVVDELDVIAAETGRTVPQVALNWLLRRPTVSSVIIGARDERQLRDNLGAVGWALDADQIARLDAASTRDAPYPYFPYYRQDGFAKLNPPLGAAR
ncbi:aldo/keto reductase [Mycolicibacterium boenickei]|uniref:Aldo/keto reductase n=1 Tax=Mycolicibacterium boenickei TaxID=146017 RepID=A0AAX3A1C5_9MYCO|nr:aldo/keto reductase [Mycolicibacterium boenickei]PEG58407.1 aldo/keto reductase [Mycolicibacterium boenickei]UNC01257.1 aldo/keto reductase [Mycolicibacterium boenickei]BBX91118.1 aldo/keto reductase [Mycolicibacterium boenickei]